MKINHANWMRLLLIIQVVMLQACTYDYFPVPEVPEPAKETATLEAKYVGTPPTTISSAYWSTADFHHVTAVNLSTGNLYSDGLLNMTGTYNGTGSFNGGSSPELVMKAAYDDQKLYILLEWTDLSLNLSNASWLHNGPTDPLKSDTATGWTSQKNNDKVALAFEIEAASGSAGTFSSVGCAASCHNNEMKPEVGKVDIWNWNLAFSEPFGYSGDMVTEATTGLSYDSGQPMFVRNNAGLTDRSGPAYEWDGVVQNITKGNGVASILDPAYYILNKTPFTGNIESGDAVYHNSVKGCTHCHGENGEGGGDFGDGPSFTRPEVNRYSRQNIIDYSISTVHTGFSYFNQLNSTERENVIAYIRGMSGVPGYYLQEPDGSNADIISASNTNLVNVNTYAGHSQYKVLLIRELNTTNTDDAVFDLTQNMEYIFGIALMDNDGKNHIGSLKETLTFLEK